MAYPANPNRAEAAASHYRPDIDGLRAIAVVPVVLYHFGIPPFTGGFVGVDVFFVISGFLIASLIRDELGRGKFSFVSFYERRIRRIFPALIAVLVASLVAAMVFFLPSDLRRYGQSLTAAAAFFSNFHFWRESGYFDVAATLKPLLHTWSLAVEEQFYLLFPLVLFLLRRASRAAALATVALLLALSLGGSIWAVHHWPSATFYLLPSRLWELMLGALLAIGAWPAPRRPLDELCIGAGLALIAYAVFAYDATTPFPGLAAVPPCLGAALVIQGGKNGDTASGRVLSWRGMVWVGLISYSLYLWHWPVLVFARYQYVGATAFPIKIALIALSVALAVLSWRYVERPFRGRRSTVTRRVVFAGAGVSIAAMALFGAVPNWAKGLPQRFPETVRAIFRDEQARGFMGCLSPPFDRIQRGDLCRLGAKTGSPTFLVWGDSIASSIAGAPNAVAARHNLTGLLSTEAACPPLLGVTPYFRGDPYAICPRVNDTIRKIADNPAISVVILVGRWALAAEGTGFREEPPPPQRLLTDASSPIPALVNDHPVFERGLRRTVESLVAAGKKVVIVAAVPEIGPAVPETLAKIALQGRQVDIRPSLDDYRERQKFVFAVFDRLAKEFPITVIYPDRILCASERCEIAIGNRPLYRDGDHLTDFGAAQLVPLFEPIIR